MGRREFTGLAAAAGMVPSSTLAQGKPGAPTIGYVHVGPADLASDRLELFLSGVRSSGQTLQQVSTVMRVASGDPARVAPMVAGVLDRKPSVFIAAGPASLRAAAQATRTVPIVAYDLETGPVAAGYAQSIARPGGNVTGVFLDMPDFSGKWLELLRESLPQLRRVALLWDSSVGTLQYETLIRIAAGLNVQTDLLEAATRADFAGQFAVARDRGARAIVLLSSPLMYSNVKELAELALRHRLPTITMFVEFARSGGLFAYGPSLPAAARQAGVMAGKVLGGTLPASLPIERPTIFELIVNQRTAEVLGVVIPPSILARADEVIE